MLPGFVAQPVPFHQVTIEDSFWAPRIEVNRLATIEACLEKCEETGRLANFRRAGGLEEGPHQGIRYDDSDVFKLLEGVCYSLANKPDPKLEARLDEIIASIAAAQEDDGYLYTARTLGAELPNMGDKRWSFVAQSHELYNVGHLYEAAAAHFELTGKRTLLDVALKNAALVRKEFGPRPNQRKEPPGHEEIELGLIKLYRVTGEKDWLDLAVFFLDQRGNHGENWGEYWQDHKPVREMDEAVGHAVRAGYLYAAMAEAAALTGDLELAAAANRIWENVAQKKQHITGGIGARPSGEAFGDNFELSNEGAYLETCAAVANALWNHRVFLATGDAKYLHVLEQTIYNGFASGVSLEGDRFFYPNPLASAGGYQRSEWFGTSCCPVNVVRFVPSIGGYVYSSFDDGPAINLYIAGSASVPAGGQTVRIKQESDYPWNGQVRITVEPEKEGEFNLRLRIPAWLGDSPLPGGLYSFVGPGQMPSLKVNGEAFRPTVDKGFAVLSRTWRKGDTVELDLPMPVRRIQARNEVAANRGRIAFQRGPIVYAAEEADNTLPIRHLHLADESPEAKSQATTDLGGVTKLNVSARTWTPRGQKPGIATLIPYATWANRGEGAMQVWLKVGGERPRPYQLARISASHIYSGDSVGAVADGIAGEASSDESIPRHTWWPRKGGTEWIEYSFDEPMAISKSRIYWFDDTGKGGCRIPRAFRILIRSGGDKWQEVASGEGVLNGWSETAFADVHATEIRLEADLQEGFSGGVLEWVIE